MSGYDIPVRKDTPVSMAIADGNADPLKTDSLGHLWVREGYVPDYVDNTFDVAAISNKPNLGTSYAWTTYVSQALDSGEVVKASAGKLKSVTALIDTAAATDEYFLQVFDATAIPADGAVTHKLPPVSVSHTNGTQSKIVINLSDPGINCTTGITVCISTTQVTKTIAGNVALFFLEYV